MITLPVSSRLGFTKTFFVETNASGYRLGAVLMQDQRPITFFSHALNSKSTGKSVYEGTHGYSFRGAEMETLSLRPSFDYYDRPKKFQIFIGAEVKYQKWIMKLMGFQLQIQYKPGLENKAANALS